MYIDYFNHPIDAFKIARIIQIRMDYDFEGIGIFWSILELFAFYNNQCQLEAKEIAFYLGCKREIVSAILEDYSLFKIDNEGNLSCDLL